MRTKTLYLAAVLALAPATLAAQDSTATTNSGGGADARVEAALAAAVSAGIPVSLLERKVAEGKAKGVPMDRIAGAVETRLDALVKARDAMTTAHLVSTTEGELSVAADAVQGGVSQTALATISQSAPQDRRAVAIAVLADLVTLGRTSEAAVTQVQAALARGPEALANLRAESVAGLQAGGGAGGAGVQVGAGANTRVELGIPRGK
ncbi:MAG: hypothetical protein H0T86_10835 [Gemmatimonadales bacterium]|nr:hypothetical protein [Gemmatimonadales bacterium]